MGAESSMSGVDLGSCCCNWLRTTPPPPLWDLMSLRSVA